MHQNTNESLRGRVVARPGLVPWRPLVVVLAFVSSGIVADRYLAISAPTWWAVGLGAWILWLLAFARQHLRLAAILLGLSGAALGGAWHHARWSTFAADDLGYFAREAAGPASIRARIVGNVSLLPARTYDPLRGFPESVRSRVRLQAEAIRDGDRWLPATGLTTLAIDGHLLGFDPGDRVEVVGQLSRTAPPLNPGEFDFAAHLRADRQLCRLRATGPASVVLLEQGASWTPNHLLLGLRGSAGRLLASQLARQRTGLAAALLLGMRDQMDDGQSQAYFLTGMVHLLSISGLHVGLLAAGLFWLARLGLVGRGWALAGVATVTVLYAWLIEAESPAVRATILVLVSCIAMAAGRRALEFNTLAASALVVLALNPADLFRIGPQLSFLAAGVLGWLSAQLRTPAPPDPLDLLVARTRPWPMRSVRAFGRIATLSLVVTSVVWLVTMPLVTTQFHLISPVAIVLTPLLAVPLAVALLAGFGLLIVGWLLSPLAAIAGWICDRGLAIGDALVEQGSRWPGGHFWIVGPDRWWIIISYALLAAWLVAASYRPRRRLAIALLVGWTAIGFGWPLVRDRQRDGLECTFLAVGHGCATVSRLPDGRTMLYDAGRMGAPHAAAQSVSAYLWSRGITRLDAVVVSHADVDHYNALPDLMARFPVDVLYVTSSMLEHSTVATELLWEAARRAGTRIVVVAEGDSLDFGSACHARVLHPPPTGVRGSDNANSIVLLVEHRDRRLLLPGDLEQSGLARLLEQPPVACEVVLAPHHGSPRSNPAGLAAWAHPRWVVISGSRSQASSLPDRNYLDSHLLHTATCGAVTVHSGENGVTVDWFRKDGDIR